MEYVLTAVLHVSCLLGLTANLIIVAANAMKWKRLKSHQTCDKILISLAISRGLYFFEIIILNSIFQFLPWLMKSNIQISIINFLCLFIFYSSLWIATILCVFYCVRIVTYNYKLFVFLKSRISTMVPWLIQVSLLISLISSLAFVWYGYDFHKQFALINSTGNMTDFSEGIMETWFWIFAVGYFPPFIIFCVANFLLIHFLLMHTRRMRSNVSHNQSPNLESHFSALKSMSLFLLLQILFLTCTSLSMSVIKTFILFLTGCQFVLLVSSVVLQYWVHDLNVTKDNICMELVGSSAHNLKLY
ncbi:hypothetical protein GDO78_017638 [Eleutherodactylus coqui]|uniref:Taste receptor type 2 n=1 Tax=Eleutherodactylus coqui TaxID=57060 RepID=A0A8J6EJZ2_ELECQ|nr:hypothetical protein GDO78_017638 [Eleutherodactylus coqui]